MNSSAKNINYLASSLIGKNRNELIDKINDHCLRLAVVQDATYDWHHHPNSDELFLILEGELTIEFQDGAHVKLKAGDLWTVPAGRLPQWRNINYHLCFCHVTEA